MGIDMKIGLIGIGKWGQKFANEYIQLMKEGVIDVAFYDMDKAKLEQFKGIETFSSLDNAVKNVDAVHICTPDYTHYDVAKKALNAGINVLIEKPMTNDSDKAYRLVELASNENLILQVGHIFRFANVIRKVRELYKEKHFGDVYHFNLAWTHLMPPRPKVDILWDLLPHPLDMMHFITGEWPKDFTGVGRSFRRNELNEITSLDMIYENNSFANIHVSWVTPMRRRTLEIVGSERSLWAECVKQELKIFENDREQEIKIESNNTMREEALNFVEAIKTGKNTFNSSIIGARSVEMIERALKSLR